MMRGVQDRSDGWSRISTSDLNQQKKRLVILSGGEAGAKDLTSAGGKCAVGGINYAAGLPGTPGGAINAGICRKVPHRGFAPVQDDNAF
jgi:UDP-N-acetylenolpyruvoylglucosamine reductase